MGLGVGMPLCLEAELQPPYRAPRQCFLNSTGEAWVSQLTSPPASLARLLQPAPPAACSCFNTSQPDDLPAYPLPIFHQDMQRVLVKTLGVPRLGFNTWLFDLESVTSPLWSSVPSSVTWI